MHMGRRALEKWKEWELDGLFFLMKLKQSETSKFSTIPVSPIMSLFNQFSTRSVNLMNTRVTVVGSDSSSRILD